MCYNMLMKSKTQVPQDLKHFTKEKGNPVDFTLCYSGEQMSKEVKQFCNMIGTALRVIEEENMCSNRSEFFIELMKEAVRKDMREAD